MTSGASSETCSKRSRGAWGTQIPKACYTSCGTSCSACSWTSCTDDVAFVAALLDQIESQFCVDTAKVRAHGVSNGGMMVFQILQSPLARRFEALVSVAGLPQWSAQRPPAAAPRFLGVWGAMDHVVPPEPIPEIPQSLLAHTDDATLSSEGLIFMSAQNVTTTIARSEAFRCEAAVVPALVSPKASQDVSSCIAFSGCAAGEVVSCRFPGGHEWPAGATALLWDFYSTGVQWSLVAAPTSQPVAPAASAQTAPRS